MSAGRFLARRVLPPIAVLIVACTGWEALVRVSSVPLYILPAPTAVARSIGERAGDLFASLGWTALAAGIGFAASSVIGVAIAIGLSTSSLLRRALYPYTVFFQTVPIIAIAPMLILWLEVGLAPVAACAFIVSVFPVIANALSGLLSTDPALADLFRLYEARPLAATWKLRLPWALPSIFTGLRIAAGLSVIGAIVAEFTVGRIVGSVGLGAQIMSATHESHTDVAFAAVLLASILGLAMFGAVNIASHITLRRWHSSEQQDA